MGLYPNINLHTARRVESDARDLGGPNSITLDLMVSDGADSQLEITIFMRKTEDAANVASGLEAAAKKLRAVIEQSK